MDRKTLYILLIAIIIIALYLFLPDFTNREKIVVEDFLTCVEAGNPVMESYPERCRDKDGNLFIQEIGNELEKSDLIRINNPRPNQEIKSPLKITGEARGFWFFEADFPIILTNWDGLIIAQHYAEAKSEWMTEDFVSFEAELQFISPTDSVPEGEEIPDFLKRGTLILQKANASGLPEHDDVLEVPVLFE